MRSADKGESVTNHQNSSWLIRSNFSRIVPLACLCLVTVMIGSKTVASADGELPTVPVRVGSHQGFDRIVFDWPHQVDFLVAKVGSKISIRFDDKAQFDLKSTPSDFGFYMTAGSEVNDSSPSAFILKAAPNTRYRSFYLDDHRIIVDVRPKTHAFPASHSTKALADTGKGPETAINGDEIEVSSKAAESLKLASQESPVESTTSKPTYAAAQDSMLANPTDPQAAYAFAEAAVASGDISGAIGALQRILRLRPNRSDIKLRLGELYDLVGRPELAAEYIRQAEESGAMPDRLQPKAEAMRSRAEKEVEAIQQPHVFGGTLFLGGRYDTNANAAPDGTVNFVDAAGNVVDAELRDEDTEQEDIAGIASANLNYWYDLGTQSRDRVEVGLTGSVTRYEDENTVNSTFVEGNVGPRYFLGDILYPSASVRPFVTASYLELDDESYRSGFGGGFDFLSSIGEARFRSTLRAVYRDYNNTDERPNAAEQSGTYVTLTPGLSRKAGEATTFFAQGLAGFNDADEDFESFIEGGVTIGVSQRFGESFVEGEPLRAALSGGYRHSRYSAPEPRIDPNKERRDDRFDISLGFQVPIYEALTLSINGRQTFNQSNIPNNEYDNTSGTIGGEYRFSSN